MQKLNKKNNDLESLSRKNYRITFTKGIEIPSEEIIGFKLYEDGDTCLSSRIEIVYELMNCEDLNEVKKEFDSLRESHKKINFTIEHLDNDTNETLFKHEYADYQFLGYHYVVYDKQLRKNNKFILYFYF